MFLGIDLLIITLGAIATGALFTLAADGAQ